MATWARHSHDRMFMSNRTHTPKESTLLAFVASALVACTGGSKPRAATAEPAPPTCTEPLSIAKGDVGNVRAYHDKLQASGFASTFEEREEDNSGHITMTKVLTLPGVDLPHAVACTASLLGTRTFPPFTGKGEPGESTIVNPAKREEDWTDEIVVTRGTGGRVRRVERSSRAEGGGYYVTVEQDATGVILTTHVVVD